MTKPLETIFANLLTSAKNTHVSVPLYLALACEILPIWLPQYESQIKHTQKVLMFYGVIAASTSAPGTPSDPKAEQPSPANNSTPQPKTP